MNTYVVRTEAERFLGLNGSDAAWNDTGLKADAELISYGDEGREEQDLFDIMAVMKKKGPKKEEGDSGSKEEDGVEYGGPGRTSPASDALAKAILRARQR
jgi:hypothetical protein